MNALDRDTLELIQETAVKAGGATNKVHVVDLGEFENGKYLIVDGNGEIKTHLAPPIRGHRLSSVGQIVPLLQFADSDSGSVWISETQITILFDDERRLDQAKLPLVKTAEFAALASISEKWLDPKSFVRSLRTTFYRALGPQREQIIKTFRSLNFGESVQGRAKIEHGRESLGRELESEIRSELGPIPEMLALDIRVFEDPDLTARERVECAVELDARNGNINLCPLPEEMQQAVQANLERIADRVTNQATEAGIEVGVLLGTP